MAEISTEKRMVLALVLSALVLLLWPMLFPRRPMPAPTPTPGATAPAPGAAVPTPSAPAPTGAPSPADTTPAGATSPAVTPPRPEGAPTGSGVEGEGPQSVQPVLSDVQEEAVVLTGRELVVHLTNRGARITQVELVNYASPFDHEERLRLLSPPEDVGALQVMDVSGQVPLAETVYQVQEGSDTSAVMEAAWSNGLQVRKTFRLDPNRFDVDMELQLTNTSQSPVTLTYLLVGSPGLHAETRKASDLAAKVCLNRTSVSDTLAGGLAKGPRIYPGAELTWLAGTNQYFAVVLAPSASASSAAPTPPSSSQAQPVEGRRTVPAVAVLLPAGNAEFLRTVAGYLVGPQANPDQAKQLARSAPPTGQAVTGFVSAPVELPPGGGVTHSYFLFCGPQKEEVLASYDAEGLRKLTQSSWYWPLVSVILFILKGFYKVTRSYGVAIILLTALIKAALLPLSLKGQASMQRMQQLQPRIKELQERHKDDKQKLAEEQMRLWREQGVSPFGGCLPTLIQIPVFIALYRALQASFDLRQRSFLWMDDLSQPDALFSFSVSLPFIGNSFNLLPILWMISIVISQKMMPKPKVQDPQMKQQQTMMMLMPLMFGVLFYGMPAGLLLYFVTQSVLTIGEQKFIRRQLDKQASAAPEAKPAKREETPSGKARRKGR